MLPNLYPLRFLLALFVIIYHVPGFSEAMGYPFYRESPFFLKGTLAVYYFFTLSGFLIIRLIYLEIAKTGGFNFKNFYIRRIQRLYPVYYLVFILGVAFFHIILPSIGISRLIDYEIKDIFLYYIFFIPNIFTHYYSPGSILTILWSIGVEEQFYLIMPLILYIGRKKLLLTIILMFIISITFLLVDSEFYKYGNYFFYFLFGGFCSVVSEKYRLTLLKNKLIHLLVYTAFVLSFFLNIGAIDNDILYHLINVVVSGFTITLIAYYPIFNLKNSTLNYLGKISYGIYMYHMIVMTGLFFILDKLKIKESVNFVFFIVLLNVIVIGLTIIVSHFSYQYFEKIFYKPKKVGI